MKQDLNKNLSILKKKKLKIKSIKTKTIKIIRNHMSISTFSQQIGKTHKKIKFRFINFWSFFPIFQKIGKNETQIIFKTIKTLKNTRLTYRGFSKKKSFAKFGAIYKKHLFYNANYKNIFNKFIVHKQLNFIKNNISFELLKKTYNDEENSAPIFNYIEKANNFEFFADQFRLYSPFFIKFHYKNISQKFKNFILFKFLDKEMSLNFFIKWTSTVCCNFQNLKLSKNSQKQFIDISYFNLKKKSKINTKTTNIAIKTNIFTYRKYSKKLNTFFKNKKRQNTFFIIPVKKSSYYKNLNFYNNLLKKKLFLFPFKKRNIYKFFFINNVSVHRMYLFSILKESWNIKRKKKQKFYWKNFKILDFAKFWNFWIQNTSVLSGVLKKNIFFYYIVGNTYFKFLNKQIFNKPISAYTEMFKSKAKRFIYFNLIFRFIQLSTTNSYKIPQLNVEFVQNEIKSFNLIKLFSFYVKQQKFQNLHCFWKNSDFLYQLLHIVRTEPFAYNQISGNFLIPFFNNYLTEKIRGAWSKWNLQFLKIKKLKNKWLLKQNLLANRWLQVRNLNKFKQTLFINKTYIFNPIFNASFLNRVHIFSQACSSLSLLTPWKFKKLIFYNSPDFFDIFCHKFLKVLTNLIEDRVKIKKLFNFYFSKRVRKKGKQRFEWRFRRNYIILKRKIWNFEKNSKLTIKKITKQLRIKNKKEDVESLKYINFFSKVLKNRKFRHFYKRYLFAQLVLKTFIFQKKKLNCFLMKKKFKKKTTKKKIKLYFLFFKKNLVIINKKLKRKNFLNILLKKKLKKKNKNLKSKFYMKILTKNLKKKNQKLKAEFSIKNFKKKCLKKNNNIDKKILQPFSFVVLNKLKNISNFYFYKFKKPLNFIKLLKTKSYLKRKIIKFQYFCFRNKKFTNFYKDFNFDNSRKFSRKFSMKSCMFFNFKFKKLLKNVYINRKKQFLILNNFYVENVFYTMLNSLLIKQLKKKFYPLNLFNFFRKIYNSEQENSDPFLLDFEKYLSKKENSFNLVLKKNLLFTQPILIPFLNGNFLYRFNNYSYFFSYSFFKYKKFKLITFLFLIKKELQILEFEKINLIQIMLQFKPTTNFLKKNMYRFLFIKKFEKIKKFRHLYINVLNIHKQIENI